MQKHAGDLAAAIAEAETQQKWGQAMSIPPDCGRNWGLVAEAIKNRDGKVTSERET